MYIEKSNLIVIRNGRSNIVDMWLRSQRSFFSFISALMTFCISYISCSNEIFCCPSTFSDGNQLLPSSLVLYGTRNIYCLKRSPAVFLKGITKHFHAKKKCCFRSHLRLAYVELGLALVFIYTDKLFRTCFHPKLKTFKTIHGEIDEAASGTAATTLPRRRRSSLLAHVLDGRRSGGCYDDDGAG